MSEMANLLVRRMKGTGRELMDDPRYGRFIEAGWSVYVRSHIRFTKFRKSTLKLRGAKIDPYKVVRVDPSRIEYVKVEVAPKLKAGSFPKPKFKRAGAVVGGDWDKLEKRFEETDIYRAFDAHFNDGVAWEDTDFFERVVDEIESGRTMWDCSSRAEFGRRCRRLDELYERIEANGYLSQRELVQKDLSDPIEHSMFPAPERFLLEEITVTVGRDGDLLFCDGRNRLSIAKVLDLDEIPVWILSRHAEWQETRDEVATNGFENVSVPRDHPDLRDLR